MKLSIHSPEGLAHYIREETNDRRQAGGASVFKHHGNIITFSGDRYRSVIPFVSLRPYLVLCPQS
jgi:hypothetical protein